MNRKQLVFDRALGRYVERYVSKGPGRARPGHGGPRRTVSGVPVGPARFGALA